MRKLYITINISEGDQFTISNVDLAGDLVDAENLLRAAIFCSAWADIFTSFGHWNRRDYGSVSWEFGLRVC